MTNLTIWQLSELLRAGWALQVMPVPPITGRIATQVMIQFVRQSASTGAIEGENLVFPITNWVQILSFEKEFGEVVEEFYQQVFPVPDASATLNA